MICIAPIAVKLLLMNQIVDNLFFMLTDQLFKASFRTLAIK